MKLKDNYEPERMWKEAVALYVKIQFPYCPKDTEERNEKSTRRVHRRFEVSTLDFRNTKQQLHRDVPIIIKTTVVIMLSITTTMVAITPKEN